MNNTFCYALLDKLYCNLATTDVEKCIVTNWYESEIVSLATSSNKTELHLNLKQSPKQLESALEQSDN